MSASRVRGEVLVSVEERGAVRLDVRPIVLLGLLDLGLAPLRLFLFFSHVH